MNASDEIKIGGTTATFASWCRSVHKLTDAQRRQNGIPVLSQAELRRQRNQEEAEILAKPEPKPEPTPEPKAKPKRKASPKRKAQWKRYDP